MKRSALGILLLTCACIAASPNAAEASNPAGSHAIKTVTLDPATACKGDTITVTVTVELDGKSYDPQKWYSTSVNGVCSDHANHDDSNGSNGVQTFTEVFTTTADVQGIGSVQVQTFAADGCVPPPKDTENAKLTVSKCGVDCWDLNENGECDLASEDTDADGACGARDCHGQPGQPGQNGQDGDDCAVEQVEGGAQICCGEAPDECVTVYNGADGADGASCTVSDNEDGSHTVTCGETSTTLGGGLDCYDLNGNHRKDFCDPNGLAEFGSCEAFLEYCATGEPLLDVTAKRRDVSLKVVDAVRMSSAFNCGFTEDANGDGAIDAYDCQGSDGSDGANGTNGGNGSNGSNGTSCTITNTATGAVIRCGDGTEVAILDGQDGTDGTDGANGTDGTDGQDGADGLPCSVADNGDGTATISCADGTSATIGGPSGPPLGGGGPPPTPEPEPEPAPRGGLCGSFDGVTFVGLLLPLFCVRRRNRR